MKTAIPPRFLYWPARLLLVCARVALLVAVPLCLALVFLAGMLATVERPDRGPA